MKINQFEANEVVFYHAITTGDTITLELTQVTENIPKTVYPVIQTITNNWFKCQFTSITGGTENLTGGTIFLKYDGYYDYKLKKNGTTIEDSQFFMIGPVPTIIENQTQNTTVINNPLSGSSGTSGSNGAAGPTGAAGTSGSSGANGLDASGSSGSSGQTGAAGSSGSSGQTGVAGSSGSSASSGLTGSSGSSGQNGLSATYYRYNAHINSQAPPVTNGNIEWNNAVQTGSTQLYVSHITQDNNDIEVILGGTGIGSRLIVQDRNVSENYQVFIVTSVTVTVDSHVTFGVTYSSGTVSFTNGHDVLLIVQSVGLSGSSGSSGTAGSSGASPGLDDLYATSSIYPGINLAKGFNFKQYGTGTPESGEYYQLSNEGPTTSTLGMGASTGSFGMVTFVPVWLNNVVPFTGIGINRVGAAPTSHRLRMALYTSVHNIGEAKTAFGYTISDANNGLVFNSGTYPTISGDTVSWSTTIAPYTACYPIPKNLVFYTDVLDTTNPGVYKPGVYNSAGSPATSTPITLPYNGLYYLMIEATDNSAITWNTFATAGVTQAFRPARIVIDSRNFYRFAFERRFAHQSLGFSLTVADMTTYTPPTAINPTYFYQSVAGSTVAGLTNTRTNPPLIWIKI